MFSNVNINISQILIVSDISEAIDNLSLLIPKNNIRVIRNEIEDNDNFLIEHSLLVLKESYISTKDKKYIILCGNSFNKESQNSLLKLLEEPPGNIIYIILSKSKSSFLQTILSRLPYKIIKRKNIIKDFELDLKKLDLKDIYNFIKDNQRINKIDSKILIESILYSINNNKIKLDNKELEMFSKSIKLIEFNSKPINILTTILLTILHRKNKI